LPDTRILAVLAHESDEYADECAGAGADGAVFFTATRDEFAAVADNLLTAPAAMTSLNGHSKNGTGDTVAKPRPRLTIREMQVLEHIAKGLSSKAIAAVLNVSVSTVQRHRFSLMTKLDLHNAAALTAYVLARARERMSIIN
jgi:DNA-binding NarL/FixJ family response regulator